MGSTPISCFREVSQLSAVWKACFPICTKPDPRSFAAKVSNRVGIYVKFLAVEELRSTGRGECVNILALPSHIVLVYRKSGWVTNYAKIYNLLNPTIIKNPRSAVVAYLFYKEGVAGPNPAGDIKKGAMGNLI